MIYNHVKAQKEEFEMKKNFPSIVRLVIIIMLLAGVGMCALWIPRAVGYLEGVCPALAGRSLLIYGGFCACVIPIFAVFFMAFAFVPAFEQDSIFDKGIARLIKKIAYVILFDCLAFGIMTGTVAAMGEALLSPLLLFTALVGLTVSAVLLILADHVDRASDLKEEVEGTL